MSQSDFLNNSIINQLTQLGINKIYAQRLFQYYHPLDVYEALDYFYSNNGIIQHCFIENKKKAIMIAIYVEKKRNSFRIYSKK